MTVEVEPARRATADLSVSATVIRVLLRLVQAGAGDVGLAQALALADEQRSFPALVDTGRRTPLAEAVTLFNAAALVTGDAAVGLHVGEEVLWSHDAEEEVDEIRSLGSPGGALRQVTSLLHHLETGSEAVVLEVASDHALVQVAPQVGEARHAHLCELTRGILTELPALFGLEPALVTEHECSARGGRFCRYAVRWAPADAVTIGDTEPSSATDQNTVGPGNGAPIRPPTAHEDPQVTTVAGAPAAEDLARGEGRTQAELERVDAEAELVRQEADTLRRRAVEEADRVKQEADRVQAEAEEARGEADRVKQEADRVRAEAEQARGEAEEARGEADRVKQEADRVRAEAEQARGEAEEARGEADRVKQEADRVRAEAEEARGEAEQAREEADRVKQEADRVRAEAEQARGEAEEARGEAEEARGEAEEAREEADRVKQEADRVRAEAEEARGEAEQARGEAEQAREEADRVKQAADRVRAEAEEARGEAEQAREEAEQAREEADRVKQAADRVRAEAEEARGEAEQAREEADRVKQTADRVRAEAEEARGEADRVKQEADRVRAEAEEARGEADRVKQEADRVRAEAEEAREEADRVRAEAEEAREEADRVRAEAEQAREEADRVRAEAEQAREEADRVRAEADHTVARLADDAQRLEWLLEGASATTLEVLDQDVAGVLGELRGRADRLVSTDRFLFMVRVGPGMPIELHHRGLGDDEAEHLATEVWRESPDDAGGTRLIVDIASPRRRYGRLAEFFEPGAPHPEGEERRLGLFARYAANALDVLTVVSEARRSDATARALLSFSEELSGMSRLGDAVQTLADTVPAVTGCDLATVYLWDESACQLVPRALSDANRTPSSYLGPIVPLGSDGRPLGGRRPEWTDAASVEADGFVAVQWDDPSVQRMLEDREILVIDGSVEDPQLRDLMARTKAHAAVVAPLFGAGKFLGVIVATFAEGTAPSVVHDPDLHERLSGLADQAATTIQNLALVERVSHMAWHDALTGLPNRRLFEDRVEQELVRSRRVGEPVCMFFVDLDNFKTVNDTYGHATGDELILQVAQRLVGTVRSQDTVARVGGDEFAILLPGLSDQLAINLLAERTLDAMHTPFVIFGTEVTTSASIGIAIAPEHGDSYDDLLNRADEAMYRAKDLGRNAFEMYRNQPDPDRPGRRALDDRELYADLIKALDGNEFFLLYQPYIDLRTAHVVGVEALIRWDHPTLGILEPSYFIDLAEKSDLIVALDSWVLWQACRQLRAWIDHDLDPLRLSVNLASRDLSNPDLFASIQRTLSETSIDPTLLELEITERVVLDKSGPARDNIDQLRRLGVRFTIDDFGSGNSSLNRIGTFPVSTLKIDQSFVHVLGPDGENNSLVSAIISMADRLGLACVAEGVETSLQSRVLLQRGCTTAQGYYFSPPLPPEDVERMMQSIVPAEVPEDFAAPADSPDGWDETAE